MIKNGGLVLTVITHKWDLKREKCVAVKYECNLHLYFFIAVVVLIWTKTSHLTSFDPTDGIILKLVYFHRFACQLAAESWSEDHWAGRLPALLWRCADSEHDVCWPHGGRQRHLFGKIRWMKSFSWTPQCSECQLLSFHLALSVAKVKMRSLLFL